jgi:hypothetical protein
MPIQLQIRRGLASQWLEANTTLAGGEIGYETDTGFFKIGTGNTVWANLKYTVSNTALTANNALFLNGNSALVLRTYTEDKAANAYSNSVTYVDTRIGVVNSAIIANAAAAYNNAAADSTAKATAAIIYADYILSVANSNIIANAATAYTNATTFSANATNLTNGTIPYGRFPVNIINTTADFTRAGVTTFNANVVIGTTAGVSANGGYGTQGQALLSNGTSVYWATATAGSNTYIQFNDSGAANASAGFTFNKTTNTVSFGNSTVNASINSTAYTGSASFVGGNTAATLRSYSDNTAATAYANGVTYVDTRIGVVNTAITSNASAAYANAVTYTDTRLITANTSMVANASAAYTNAVSYIDGKIGTANVAITGNAAAAYANSVTYTDGKILTANAAITGNAATAYSNAVTYVDTRIGVVNTAITGNSATAYANGVTYTDTRIGVVNTAITGNSATAYSNAVSYVDNKLYVNTSQLSSNLSNYQTTAGLSANVATLSANNSTYLNGQLAAYYTNATNISTGTIAESRLPYRLNQNLTTTNNVTFANISLTGGTLSTLPVSPSDIVNKQYADAIASGVNFHPAVRLSTTVTFDATTATYNNGTNGVNATITDNSPYVAISLDGVTAAYGDRVLMRTVSNTAWNGIYVVSNTGSASYPWILTRSFDYDQVGSGTNEIDQGDLIYVLAGSSLAGTSWVQQNNVTTIGTDGISFVQFSSKALYPLTEGAGLYYSVGGAYDGSAASTLAVNTTYIATLTANNAAYLGGTVASGYQTTAGLSGNVVTLTANLANYVIANTGIVSNSSGVFVNSAYISSISSVNANTANNSLYLGGVAAASYQLNSTLSANVATLTANNTNNLGGQLPAYYTNATNITTGSLPYAQIPVNVINTTAAYTISGVHTHTANIVISTTAGISANSSYGTSGQVLTSNGTTVYWAAASSGGFTNGQSISVANLVVTGSVTANSSTGTAGQALTTNGTSVYWSTIVGTNAAASYSWTNTHTFNSNVTLATTAALIANGLPGTAGQMLTSNGTTVYWSTVSSGGTFTNGQSISVTNLTVTGSVTANSTTGTAGQILTSNGSASYWANSSAAAATAVRQSFTGDGTTTSFTITGGYTASQVSVFLNGVMLRNGSEVTVSSGTAVVFGSAPPIGALIDVIGSLSVVPAGLSIGKAITLAIIFGG